MLSIDSPIRNRLATEPYRATPAISTPFPTHTNDHVWIAAQRIPLRNDATPEAAFERWLFVHAAGVLIADKAGELLAIAPEQFGMAAADLDARLTELGARWEFEFASLYATPQSVKVIVYRSERVREQLRKTPPCTLCETLGYCAGVEPADFLAEIARRWYETGGIPHEIGLALGYPVKDVLGYMGQNGLDCTGHCGWRVYGNPAPSLAANQRYMGARIEAMRNVAILDAACARP